jgi:hypothetical protein
LRRRVLIRTDSGGGTHHFLAWLTRPGRRLHYSVGMTITGDIQDAILKIPAATWTPAYGADGQVRLGAWVAEITGTPDLAAWPKGMRVIVRKERPHPGAQLRFTDIDGHRFTCLATDARHGQLADLELRHSRRLRLRLAATWPQASQITTAITRLQALAPGRPAPKPSLRPGRTPNGARGTPPARRDSRATALTGH